MYALPNSTVCRHREEGHGHTTREYSAADDADGTNEKDVEPSLLRLADVSRRRRCIAILILTRRENRKGNGNDKPRVPVHLHVWLRRTEEKSRSKRHNRKRAEGRKHIIAEVSKHCVRKCNDDAYTSAQKTLHRAFECCVERRERHQDDREIEPESQRSVIVQP